MGQAMRGIAGLGLAVLLAKYGPVVAGADTWPQSFAAKELEETAKLALITRGVQTYGPIAPQR